jgi:hypothetical protein
MSGTSELFRTHAEMLAALEFIQGDEHLTSGSLASGSGVNRSLERLARNSDAVYEALQAARNMVISGGGTLGWNAGTGQFSWSATLYFQILNPIGGATSNSLAVGSSPLTIASGAVAYVRLDRAGAAVAAVGVAANFAAFLALVQGSDYRLEYQLLAYRDGNSLVLWDGRRIKTNESLTTDGCTDTQYGQQTELTTVHDNQLENFRMMLHGGGDLSWDQGTATFTWSSDLHISFPSYAGDNKLAAGSQVIAAGSWLVATLLRKPGASNSIAYSSVADGSVSNGDNTIAIAYHDPTDGRLYLLDGTSLSDGETRPLGGAVYGVQFAYRLPGDGGQDSDLTEGGSYPARSYVVGTGDLFVYRNGVKARCSTSGYWAGGSYPAGALVGSITAGDDYVEEDVGDGTGNRIIWLRDDVGGGETLKHAAGTHTIPKTWPTTADHIEAYVGIHGEGPSPVESVGALDLGGAPIAGTPIDGDVKLKEGANVVLSYDAPNNAIVISAAISAGVSSLTADAGGSTAGGVTIAGGNKIATSRAGTTITINCQISNMADLDDISGDIADAVKGGDLPSSSNVYATHSVITHLVGFEVISTVTPTDMRISPGMLIQGGKKYPSGSAGLSCGPADTLAGDAPSGTDWAYLYIGPGAAPNDPPEPVIAATGPTAEGVHPSDSTLVFLASVYVIGGAAFHPFTKRGSWVDLHGHSVDISHTLDVNSGAAQAIDVRAALPGSYGGPSVKFALECTADAGGRYEFQWAQGTHATGIYRNRKMSILSGYYYTFDFDAAMDDNGEVEFVFHETGTGSLGSVDGLYLLGYAEHTYQQYTGVWS